MVGLSRVVEEHRPGAALITLFAVTQLLVLAVSWNKPIIWDSAVYLAMGKYLFSSGAFGFWEVFRPPVIPLVAGIAWSTGLPAAGTRLISVTVSVAGVAAIYYMVQDLYSRDIAVLTAGMMAASHTYYYFTTHLLTGIPASIMVFASLYMVKKDRYLLGGLLGGLAFLTRFPAALVGPAAVAAIALEIYYGESIREALVSATKYTAAFFSLAVPYMVLNRYFLGSLLLPFTRSFGIPASNQATYTFGLHYFLTAAANPLVLLLPVGLYAVYRERERAYIPFLVALVVFYSFFTYFPLKLERYTLLFLPLMTLFAARGVTSLQQKFRRPEIRKGWMLALLAILLVSFSMVYGAYDYPAGPRTEFYSRVSGLEGMVASNDPVVNAYGDFRYQELPPPQLQEVLDRYSGEVDYWAINGCAWNCRPTVGNCRKRIESFESTLAERYAKSFEVGGQTCNYTIYSSR